MEGEFEDLQIEVFYCASLIPCSSSLAEVSELFLDGGISFAGLSYGGDDQGLCVGSVEVTTIPKRQVRPKELVGGPVSGLVSGTK